jgi:hypothetical protein
MPFERTDEKIELAIVRAITEMQEIREGLERTGYEGREIIDELMREREQLWEVALEGIRKYDALEEAHKKLSAQVDEEAGPAPPEDEKLGVTSLAPDWMLVPGGLYVFALFVVTFIFLVRDWRAILTLRGWEWIGAFVVPPILWYAVYALIGARRRSSQTERRAAQEQRITEWREKYRGIAKKRGLDLAENPLASLHQEIEETLFASVTRALNAAINRRTAPSYATTLDIQKPRGFSEVFDKRFTIVTESRRRLQFMLNRMPGGSIGIAGSRGAGKTTLLKLFCGPKRVIEKLNDKPVLGVLVSAPVAYQARDFILYLFSAVCQNVIEAEGGKYKAPSAPEDAPPSDLLDSPALAALRPLPSLSISVGLSLVLLSLLLSFGLAALKSEKPGDAATAQPPAQTAQSGQQQQQSQQPGLTTQGATPTQGATGAQASAEQSAAKKDDGSFASRWVGELKIDPGALLAWGITFVVAGLVLAGLLRRNPWRVFVISVVRMLRSTLGLFAPYGKAMEALLASQYDKEERERAASRAGSVEQTTAAPPVAPPDGLWAKAETWLKAIKFQQSYTSGWSGSIKLPVGLEGGVSRAVTLAQNQLSLPEVVHFLTKFLEDVSLKYQVIIGIDEMDKLASDEQAQQFLNDIKSIFGLERCFYLISVSENAMSNFERRGLPFRDAFDSSFDDFVYVDHLNFESAQELLQQRLVGRPIPFFGMSYCMSGGLARDLIRNFRGVLEVFERNPAQNGLSAICEKIVNTDLLAKVRAIRTSAKKIELEPDADQFMSKLSALESRVFSDALLLDAAKALVAMRDSPQPADAPAAVGAQVVGEQAAEVRAGNGSVAARGQTPTRVDRERAAKREKLEDLGEELGTYTYCAVTLRQFFRDTLPPAALKQPPAGGGLDDFAKARRGLGVDPRNTRDMLNAFRAAHKMASLP